MATIIKTWDAAVVLHQTVNYGGSAAVLAADGDYDYSSDVDLESAGNQGAQVLVEFTGNNDIDDLIVDVFASLDGTTYDTEPFISRTIKNKGKRQAISFLVEGLAHFRLGLRSFSTNTSFKYQITQQIWILTNA